MEFQVSCKCESRALFSLHSYHLLQAQKTMRPVITGRMIFVVVITMRPVITGRMIFHASGKIDRIQNL